MFTFTRCAAALALLLTCSSSSADAQGTRLLEFGYTPTSRGQIAIWIENAEGTFMGTVRLTEAVSLRGIANRPGALQMNSGFRWPFGRREGTLPIWAFRRAAAPDTSLFPRVIFQDRTSEGFASRTTVDASRDDYFCLSFDKSTTGKDALDAVTCASVFNSDKGRFITQQDVDEGYGEPFDNGTTEIVRELSLSSFYPPRRDVTTKGSDDHADITDFADEAKNSMPDIDAVTMATPAGQTPQLVQFSVPSQWPDGDYIAWLEINVEGDHNSTFSPSAYPTPMSDRWDMWAETFGYAYRGQPSVVYSVPFSIGGPGDYFSNSADGYGDLHGLNATLFPIDSSISNDPQGAPGSGADRLLANSAGHRFDVHVLATGVCDQLDPPPQCTANCDVDTDCDSGFVCTAAGTCTGICDIVAKPDAISNLTVENHANKKLAHRVSTLSFTIPQSTRSIRNYVVKASNSPIDDSNWEAAEPVKVPALNDDGDVIAAPGNALQIPSQSACESEGSSELCAAFTANASGVCAAGIDQNSDGDCLDPGDDVILDIAFFNHETTYYVAMRALDICQGQGDLATSSVTTSPIDFTTVSPCFVATAAYGSPLANEIWALRRFRDRYLMNNPLGRSFVEAYYTVGPPAAYVIADHDWLRSIARSSLTPFVELAKWLTSETD